MSLEALWTVQFADVEGWVNGGVVVLETGRLFGGDAQYYYLGTYQATHDEINAKARIVHYEGPLHTAFGDDATDFTVELHGKREGDVINGQMYRTNNPQNVLPIRLTRRANLP